MVPAEIAAWLDAVLGDAPIELDRAAGALLRYCRDHAGALREARSAQLDRMLAPATISLAEWLTAHVAGDWILPHKLAPALHELWKLAHGNPVVVARALVETLDDTLGHRFVSIFRRRGEWRVAPGEPFPVVQPDLRRLFAPRTPLVTMPDRRETPIDRTRRLALAPAADGIEVALDLSQAAAIAPPGADAMIAIALPIAAPTRELDWTSTTPRGGRPIFHDVRPVASTDVAARVETLLVEACKRGVHVVVFPELSIDEAALARVRDVLARTDAPPLVIAGSRHQRTGGTLRNVATMISGGGEATHAKFNPYFAGEHLEDITLVPAEVRAHGTVDDTGKLGFAVVMVVCKDFLAPGAQHALEALRPTMVLVPAWSQKTAIFESDAIGLTGKTQAIVVIANQADAVADGTEDPAVVIMTLPVPALSPVIVRRGEVTPPDLVVTSLSGEW